MVGVGQLVDDDVFGRAGDDEIDALGAERLGGGGAARDGEELEALAARGFERGLERTPLGLEPLEALDVGDRELVGLGRGRKRRNRGDRRRGEGGGDAHRRPHRFERRTNSRRPPKDNTRAFRGDDGTMTLG